MEGKCRTLVFKNKGQERRILLFGFQSYLVIIIGKLQNLGKILDTESECHDTVGPVLRETLLFEGKRGEGDMGGVHSLHGDGGWSGIDIYILN